LDEVLHFASFPFRVLSKHGSSCGTSVDQEPRSSLRICPETAILKAVLKGRGFNRAVKRNKIPIVLQVPQSTREQRVRVKAAS
jgi:hypothetical protein